MDISIQGKGMDLGEAFSDHIHNSLTPAVTKYFENPTSAAVTVFKEGSGFKVDITAHVSKRVYVSAGSDVAGDVYAAFADALEHVTKRLRRNKRKLVDHKPRTDEAQVLQAAHYVLRSHDDEAQEETSENPLIIAETAQDILTLSVSDAVMHMDLSGKSWLLFRNAKHSTLNVIYIRDDGNIGWIEPKV
ncbi:MAG: ribosome-associated translation inhibitor RaiA [Pseudomonadota bacterium]